MSASRVTASATQVPLSEYLATTYRPDCDYIDGDVKKRTLGTRAHGFLQGILGDIFLANSLFLRRSKITIANFSWFGVLSRQPGRTIQIQPLQRSSTMANMRYSEAGLRLTKQFEGLELSAYQDQGGVWTIGYGHTGPNVHGGLTITEEQAEQLLESDIAASVTCVNRAVKPEIEQHHFDALVDFVFNLGATSLLTSTLLRHVNAGRLADAAEQFLLWDHCKGVIVPGLLRRRQAEMKMFLQPALQLEAVAAWSEAILRREERVV